MFGVWVHVMWELDRTYWHSPQMPITVAPLGELFPLGPAHDVTVLVDLLGRAATDDRLRNSLVDHFAYVAGVHPDWFRPHQHLVVTERLEGFDVAFDDLCVLLDGAPDTCVEHLERRLHTRWSFKGAQTARSSRTVESGHRHWGRHSDASRRTDGSSNADLWYRSAMRSPSSIPSTATR